MSERYGTGDFPSTAIPMAAREMTPDELKARDAQIIERLAVLITTSGRGLNYTAALDMAKFMVEASRRCGWFLHV